MRPARAPPAPIAGEIGPMRVNLGRAGQSDTAWGTALPANRRDAGKGIGGKVGRVDDVVQDASSIPR